MLRWLARLPRRPICCCSTNPPTTSTSPRSSGSRHSSSTLDAAVVLVAHDRWFLESVGTSVLELEGGRGRFFSGPWHAWRAEKVARELAAGRETERANAEIARMERFVERFRYKASKARQAQSKLKRIERVRAGIPDAAPTDGRALAFSFGDAERSGRVVLELEDARVEVPGRTLLERAELWLERGEHVTLIGANGSGKSTLVESLVGRRPLAEGKLRRGHNVELGYLTQHADDEGDAGATVLTHAQRATGLSEAKTRGLLGRFLFSGEEVEKSLADLSGGESQRLALALLTSSGANLLILDEPTNHLDLESREALEDALTGFAGTRAADLPRPGAAGGGRLTDDRDRRRHPAQPCRRLGRIPRRARGRACRRRARRPPGRRRRRSAKGPSKNRQARIAELEREVEAAEASFRALEDELADPTRWGDPKRAAESSRRHAKARRELDQLYARWEKASEEAGG